MDTTHNAGQLDQFRELLRTIDPAVLNHDDRAALIDLLQASFAAAGST